MNVDVEYLKNCIGRCLVEGLVEVADHRPEDPINFLAYWIYRYKQKLNEEEKVAYLLSFFKRLVKNQSP